MKSLFDEKQAESIVRQFPSIPRELALRIYTSRLIGQDPRLVLHGGGNTSVKIVEKNIFQEPQEVLYIKGSGIDLSRIGPEGFARLDLIFLRKLRALSDLPSEEMENQLRIHKLEASGPDPSVETLVHAFLPHRYIDHSHADFILALTHQKDGEAVVAEALGEGAAVIPYAMPGIPLAQAVWAAFEKNPQVEAIAVVNHGLFTFGEDARSAYERMIRYVSRAERLIQRRMKPKGREKTKAPMEEKDLDSLKARLCQTLRGACSYREPGGARTRFLTELRDSPQIREASGRPDAPQLARSGVLTPDHVSRTKNEWVYLSDLPAGEEEFQKEIREAVERYKAEYAHYFQAQIQGRKISRTMLDPYPRVFLVRGVGIVALGRSQREARIAADIAEHTLKTKILAKALGSFEPMEASHIFDVEYWPLQQKKISAPSPSPLQGQVAFITGAGGAIGLGIADRLLAAGAAVALSDIDVARLAKVESILSRKYPGSAIETVAFDVTDYRQTEEAFETISRRLGGMDILVPNAGVAHVARLEDLDPGKFDRVMAVNLKGVFHAIKASVPIFKRQGTGGNIIVVSSKNVFDPGASFGAYSVSKAGAHQLGKIAALELAEYGVRVNLVNPDAVFGDEEVPSKLWEEVGPDRMKARGLDPRGLREYYRQRNLLKVSVAAEHVGNAVVFFASELTPTTGATLPIDGGIPAAFPR